MNPPIDEKYIVFKRSDWDAHKDQVGCIPESLAVPDAVVIRRQDAFAPPALEMYASGITMALALADKGNGHATYLRQVADWFQQNADLSWQTNRKIPD